MVGLKVVRWVAKMAVQRVPLLVEKLVAMMVVLLVDPTVVNWVVKRDFSMVEM